MVLLLTCWLHESHLSLRACVFLNYIPIFEIDLYLLCDHRGSLLALTISWFPVGSICFPPTIPSYQLLSRVCFGVCFGYLNTSILLCDRFPWLSTTSNTIYKVRGCVLVPFHSTYIHLSCELTYLGRVNATMEAKMMLSTR